MSFSRFLELLANADSNLLEGQTEKTSDPTAYLLSRELMLEQAYPIPSILPNPLPEKTPSGFKVWQRSDGWIEAPYSKKIGNGPRKVLGIDCEMVSNFWFSISTLSWRTDLIE